MNDVVIREADINDVDVIFDFINQLALYEKAPEEVIATPSTLKETLFNDTPQANVLIAEIDKKPVGFAVYFYSYSTWLGKQGIYLEDLFVPLESRGFGAGKALLKRLAEIAVEKGCGRVEWSVLDWNQPAIDFYESFGAKPQDEWTVYRLTGDALNKFAKS